MFDFPEISGKLYRRVRDAYLLNDEIRDSLSGETELSDDDLITFINSKCVVASLYLNSLNIVRAVYNDVQKKNDWFRPFVRSMLIWTEDNYRSKLSMLSLLADPLDGLRHSTFFNMVANGVENPFLEWKQHYRQ